jgi:ubiquinone/menaquinone biosynthesis C-methylase UbiE
MSADSDEEENTYRGLERREEEVTQQIYNNTAATGYDQVFAHVSSHFIPFLLHAGRLASGQRVLDVGTGTGLAAKAALTVVGPVGYVTATDISPDMVDRARQRLAGAPNVSVGVEDGQALGFADENFDTVLCSLGLMFFPDPARGLAEFHRVLRVGGRAAVSVNTVPERSYNSRVHSVMARYVPSLAPAASHLFSLGEESRLRALFEAAGFQDVEVSTESHRFPVRNFETYFEQFEQGWGSPGQTYVSLPKEIRRAVREDVRRDVGDTGGPIEIEVEFRFASGQK